MTHINCRFDFHPVGQGLFYSGQINDFHFVYDCGARPGKQYAQAALASYKAPDAPLDLLIISHFHEDHTNAVEDLLRKVRGVKEVIIPYLFPAERLLVGAGYAFANDLDELSDDYISFLNDPVGYLTDFGAGEAAFTFLRSGDAVEEWPDAGEQVAGNYGWYPEAPESSPDDADEILRRSNVSLRLHSSIYRAPQWGFKFYCKPGKASAADIQKELLALTSPIDVKDIPRVLKNRLKDLKGVYKKLFKSHKDQNNTSVVCCHGPARPRRTTRDVLYGVARVALSMSSPGLTPLPLRSSVCFSGHYLFDMHGYWRAEDNRPFLLPPLQLLTGDANIIPKEYQTHFTSELDAIGLALLPHHGSKHNWDNVFPSMMPNCMLWVASSGLGNKDKHPNTEVVKSVVDAKRQLVLCNEIQHVAISVDGWRQP